MVFCILVSQFYYKMSKKVEDDKKVERKQSSATIMTSVDGKGTVFPVKLKLLMESIE